MTPRLKHAIADDLWSWLRSHRNAAMGGTVRCESGRRAWRDGPAQPAFGASQSPMRLPVTWVLLVTSPAGLPGIAGMVIVASLVTS